MKKLFSLPKLRFVVRVILFLSLIFAFSWQPNMHASAYCTDGLMFATVRISSGGNNGEIWQWNPTTSTWSLLLTSTIQFDAIARNPNNCSQLFLISNNSAANGANAHFFYTIDISVPSLTQIGSTGISTLPDNADRLGYNSLDSTLYALVGATMYTINTTTGAATSYCTVGGTWSTGSGGDIAFDKNGMLWAVRQNTLHLITYAPGSCTGYLQDSTVNPGTTVGHTGLGIDQNGRLITTEWLTANGATATISNFIPLAPFAPDPTPGGTAYNPGGYTPPYPVNIDGQQASDLTDAGSDAPTPVVISGFAAASFSPGMLISWQTEQEISMIGFNLYRVRQSEEQLTKINPMIIPAKESGAMSGSSYTFIDSDVLPGQTYLYWLEAVDTDGIAAWEGPVNVSANGCIIWFLAALGVIRGGQVLFIPSTLATADSTPKCYITPTATVG